MGKEVEQTGRLQWGSQAKGLQGQKALSDTPAQQAQRDQGCKPEGTGAKATILPLDSASQAVPRSLQKPTHCVTCCCSLTLSGLSFGNSSSGLCILQAGAGKTPESSESAVPYKTHPPFLYPTAPSLYPCQQHHAGLVLLPK